jgi:hypothetical protein
MGTIEAFLSIVELHVILKNKTEHYIPQWEQLKPFSPL